MKITVRQLRKLIREEVENAVGGSDGRRTVTFDELSELMPEAAASWKYALEMGDEPFDPNQMFEVVESNGVLRAFADEHTGFTNVRLEYDPIEGYWL